MQEWLLILVITMHTNLKKEATCHSRDSKVIKYSGIFYLINLCKYAFVGKSVVSSLTGSSCVSSGECPGPRVADCGVAG